MNQQINVYKLYAIQWVFSAEDTPSCAHLLHEYHETV